MAATVCGSFFAYKYPNRGPEYGPVLWKTTVTVPAAATSVSVEPTNPVAGTVVAVWIDPGTLAASATIKGYMQSDGLATLGPTYFLNYTVPNPAVETRDALATRVRVDGKLQVDVASAVAGNSFTLYVWVDPNAEVNGTVSISQTAGANGVTVLAAAYGSRQTITRPDNTEAYGAGDVIGHATDATAALTFPIGPTGGGEMLITSTALEIDAAAVPSGMGNFTLHLYSVTPPSALGDAATWDLPAGDRASYLGYISLGTPVDKGSTLYVQQEGVNKQITLAGANLFAYLATDAGFTPSASTVKAVSLHAIRL